MGRQREGERKGKRETEGISHETGEQGMEVSDLVA